MGPQLSYVLCGGGQREENVLFPGSQAEGNRAAQSICGLPLLLSLFFLPWPWSQWFLPWPQLLVPGLGPASDCRQCPESSNTLGLVIKGTELGSYLWGKRSEHSTEGWSRGPAPEGMWSELHHRQGAPAS